MFHVFVLVTLFIYISISFARLDVRLLSSVCIFQTWGPDISPLSFTIFSWRVDICFYLSTCLIVQNPSADKVHFYAESPRQLVSERIGHVVMQLEGQNKITCNAVYILLKTFYLMRMNFHGYNKQTWMSNLCTATILQLY